jgi:hypothetical protein
LARSWSALADTSAQALREIENGGLTLKTRIGDLVARLYELQQLSRGKLDFAATIRGVPGAAWERPLSALNLSLSVDDPGRVKTVWHSNWRGATSGRSAEHADTPHAVALLRACG